MYHVKSKELHQFACPCTINVRNPGFFDIDEHIYDCCYHVTYLVYGISNLVLKQISNLLPGTKYNCDSISRRLYLNC